MADKGYCGKILNVDLSTQKISYQDLNEAFYREYLSRVGLWAKIIWGLMKLEADPMDQDNILGFTTNKVAS